MAIPPPPPPRPAEFNGAPKPVAQGISAMFHARSELIELTWRESLSLTDSRMVIPFTALCGIVDEVRYHGNRAALQVPPGAMLVRFIP